jgi:RNA polymerase sigma factor (sigma-70 family)
MCDAAIIDLFEAFFKKICTFTYIGATFSMFQRQRSKKLDLADEQELIHACINGNRAAQKHVFETLSGKMLAICARYCQNMEDARDAMQEGFIKVFNTLERFNHKSKLDTWVTRIMINTAIDTYKKNNKLHFIEHTDNIGEYDEEESIDLSEYDHEERMKIIYQALHNLPAGYRTVFNLYVMEGLTHKEIAEVCEISPGTSKSQLARARAYLHKELKNKILV